MKMVPKAVSRKVGRQLLTAKKNSPHIFFAAGVVGAVASTVMACRATLKVSDTLDHLNHDVEEVKGLGQFAVENPKNSYSEEDYYKDLGYVYVKGAASVAKLYAPSVIVGVASIASLTGSHVTMARRNAALTATVGMLSTAFESYRGRVRAEFGKDRELEIYHNTHPEVIEVEGVEQEVQVHNPNGWSPYARFFDEGSPNWEKNAEYNRLFIQAVQNYFNHMLNSRGHVFLNEVYDHLGIERSQEGSVVGWVRGGDGDGFIDFGIFDTYNRDFVNGNERTILLDFNVDGVVYDKI